jgi:hypothetical protein
MRVTSISLIILLFPLVLYGQAKQDYLWPTEASTFLSSTFGETRAAHFHAGLDIKTWGREGYKVFATKDGHVHRIGISAKGYGKVIYLKHDDGSYSLYAHLQSFNTQIQAYADSIRFQDYSFEMDHELPPGRIKVSQGETIGLSGSSGIGPPHLHFEIRRPNENPFNALSTNLEVKDNRPPVMHSMLIEPLSSDASIEGGIQPRVIRPEWNKKGYFDFGEVSFSGDVGLALDVYDEADEVYNKYAAYELILLSGQDTLFYSRLDEYDYDHASDMFLDRALDPKTGRRRFQRLYDQPALDVEFARPEFCGCLPDSGQMDLDLIARDYYGNSVRGRIILKRDGNAASNIKAVDLTEEVMIASVWGDHWLSTIEGSIDFSSVADALIPFPSTLSPYDSTHSRLWINSEKKEFLAWKASPHEELTVHSADQKFTLRFDEQSHFKAFYTIMPFYRSGRPENELILYPQDYISRNKFTIEYYIDEDEPHAERLALFKYNRFKDRWEFFDARRVGNTLIGRNNEYGLYKAMPDTLAPEIGKGEVIRNESGQWLLKVMVTDEGTGIHYQQAEMSVNGRRGIAEYDKEDDFLIYYHPDFTPGKINQVEVKIGDFAGNMSSASFSLSYPGNQM